MAEKRFKKVVKNSKTWRKKTVRYWQKWATISPWTKKWDSYCARSLWIKKKLKKSNPKKARDPNSPNNLSRKKRKCSWAKSRRK